MKSLRHIPALLAGVFLAVVCFGLPSLAVAQGSTYTLNRSFTGAGGVTGTAVLVLDNSTMAASTAIGNFQTVPVQLVSATLTFSNLPAAPSTTTYNRAQLSGFRFVRNGAGAISDINFFASTANPDGYTLNGISLFNTRIVRGAPIVVVNNAAAAALPAPIPTLSEWAMILFGLTLAGGAALYLQRRQMIA